MIIEISVPNYEGKGIPIEWEENSVISVKLYQEDNVVAIGGNREGLISLARHLLTLAQENVPSGFHVHLDDQNSLEEGSCELILGRV